MFHVPYPGPKNWKLSVRKLKICKLKQPFMHSMLPLKNKMATNRQVKDAKNQLRIGQATLKNQNRPSKQSQLYLQQQEGLLIQQGSDEQQMGKGENMYSCMRFICGTLINLKAKNSRLQVLNKKVLIPPCLSRLYDTPDSWVVWVKKTMFRRL